MSERKDLGWANGNPALMPRLNECDEDGHEIGYLGERGCVTICYCDTCGYEFRVDSSD
jgi:hypothetical protein